MNMRNNKVRMLGLIYLIFMTAATFVYGFDIPDEPMAKTFSDFMWDIDKEKMDQKTLEQALYKFQTFFGAIQFDYTKPFNWKEDLKGLEGWAILGVSNKGGFENNPIRSYVSPT